MALEKKERNDTINKKKVVLYIRAEKSEAERQIHELRKYCGQHSWQVLYEYIDIISPEDTKISLPHFHSLFEDFDLGQFDVVVFYRLSDFGWKSFDYTHQKLMQLKNHDIGWHSLTQPLFSTETVHATMMFSYLDILNSIKSSQHSERTKIGIESSRRKGIRIGRPGIPESAEQEVVKKLLQGLSYTHIIESTNYIDSKGTVRPVSRATISNIRKKNSHLFKNGG